jgi:hypothetical protein
MLKGSSGISPTYQESRVRGASTGCGTVGGSGSLSQKKASALAGARTAAARRKDRRVANIE